MTTLLHTWVHPTKQNHILSFEKSHTSYHDNYTLVTKTYCYPGINYETTIAWLNNRFGIDVTQFSPGNNLTFRKITL